MNKPLIAAFALAFILLCGCISDWKVVAKPINATITKPEGKASQIYVFDVASSWDASQKYFTGEFDVQDQYGKDMAAPGTVTVSILDSGNVQLYKSTFHVAAADYNATTSSYGFFNSTSYAYYWDIPYSAVNRSNYSSTSGTANMRFVPDGGGSALTQDSWVTLPDDLVAPIANNTVSSTVNEGNTAGVSCENGYVISDYTSTYGTNCPSSAGVECGQCTLGANSCAVAFNNANCGGDPCYGTVKKGTLTLVCVSESDYPGGY